MPGPKKDTPGAKKETPRPLDGFDKASVLASRGLVYIEKSVTKNVGDHNFAKVTIGVALPINYTDDDIANVKATIKKVDSIVELELEKNVESLMHGE